MSGAVRTPAAAAETVTRSRLAVWGDPIAHSKSPELHAAAYRVLGLDWEYGRRRVSAEGFASAIAELDDTWRGLSLTMPLKEEAFRAAATRDRHAQLTGAVNTLLLGEEPAGFNTDVGGIVDALAEAHIAEVERVRILGAGPPRHRLSSPQPRSGPRASTCVLGALLPRRRWWISGSGSASSWKYARSMRLLRPSS